VSILFWFEFILFLVASPCSLCLPFYVIFRGLNTASRGSYNLPPQKKDEKLDTIQNGAGSKIDKNIFMHFTLAIFPVQLNIPLKRSEHFPLLGIISISSFLCLFFFCVLRFFYFVKQTTANVRR